MLPGLVGEHPVERLGGGDVDGVALLGPVEPDEERIAASFAYERRAAGIRHGPGPYRIFRPPSGFPYLLQPCPGSVDPTGMEFPYLERLTAAECRALLPAASVGRLAVPTPTFPTVDLVSFALAEGGLVVAVRGGSAGDAVAAGTRVAFESDVLDHRLRSGWSVTVTGPVEELDDATAQLVAPKLSPWPPATGDRLLLIRADRINGQRVVAAPGAPSPTFPPAPAPVAHRSAINMRRRVTGADEGLFRLADGGQRVGRLAISVAGEPLIFPVNYALDGDAVIFRTRVGTKLSGITRSMAAFAVDQIDGSGQGWSVVLQGLAQEVLDADSDSLRERIAALTLETWPGGDRPNVVRITPYLVQGAQWTAAVPAVEPQTAATGASSS